MTLKALKHTADEGEEPSDSELLNNIEPRTGAAESETGAAETLVARTAGELDYACRVLSASFEIGCDTETAGFSSRRSRLLSVQMSDGRFSVLVPASEGVRLGPLAGILASDAHVKIFHNAKFDYCFLRDAGYTVRGVFDSMIAEKLITRGADQSSSLAETLYRYFAVDLDKTKREAFSSRRWDGRWTRELVEYALADVTHLPELKRRQEAWLERLNLKKEFNTRMAKLLASL
jgi:ribonuclease D